MASRVDNALWLHLFGLSGFAFAQPLLDLLGRHPQFFASRAADPLEIVGMLVGLLVLLPLGLWSLVRVVGFASERAAFALGVGLIGGLVALTVAPPLQRFTSVPELVAVAALLLGAGGAALYVRSLTVRRFATVLALAPLVFAISFVTRSDLRPLLLPPDAPPLVTAIDQHGGPPVVLVVFDELPLSSLLDADGAIDTVRYPAFAALAAGSTWYPGASTVSIYTTDAVPAILTGRYPSQRDIPATRGFYLDNLFSLFNGRYELNIVESETQLSHVAHVFREPLARRVRTLVGDLSLLHLHIVLPQSWRTSLRPVTGVWGSFSGNYATSPAHDEQQHGGSVLLDRFIESIPDAQARAGDRSILHFAHVSHPHQPWFHLASGLRYGPDTNFGLNIVRWSPRSWWSLDAYRRHLLQLRYADRQLGELLTTLRETGLYDRALLIVTADHGISFWPGERFRSSHEHPHPGDMLNVPLFAKAPEQRKGVIDRRTVELIDILPTISQAAGIEIPWEIDGCSLTRSDCPVRRERRVWIPRWSAPKIAARYPPEIVSDPATLERKLEHFGSGHAPERLYAHGPDRKLFGVPVSELPVHGVSVGQVMLDDLVRQLVSGERRDLVPARIVGTLELDLPPERPPHVAVAIDDVIEAVVPAPMDKRRRVVSALLPERVLPRVALDNLDLYLIQRRPGGPTLAPLDVR